MRNWTFLPEEKHPTTKQNLVAKPLTKKDENKESSTTHQGPVDKNMNTWIVARPSKAKYAFNIGRTHKVEGKKELVLKNSKPSGIGKPTTKKSVEQAKTDLYSQLSEDRLSFLLHRVSKQIRHLQRSHERSRRRRRICRRIVRILNNMCGDRLSPSYDNLSWIQKNRVAFSGATVRSTLTDFWIREQFIRVITIYQNRSIDQKMIYRTSFGENDHKIYQKR